MNCLLNVVAYLGSRENASMPNVLQGSWARILGVSLGILHVVCEFNEEFIRFLDVWDKKNEAT